MIIMSTLDRRNLVFALVLMASVCALAALASSVAATDVTGDIVSDTHWTAPGNPWSIKSDVTVQTGAVLYIEPGVNVSFTGSFFIDTVGSGRIEAQGTYEERILITSANALPQVGDWNYISTGVRGVLQNCTIEFGTQMVMAKSQAKIIDCNIRIAVQGITLEGASGVVHNTTLWGHQVGLAASSASNWRVSNSDADNCQEGFNMVGSTSATVFDGCTNNPYL
jgi:hypothetical protein